MDLLATNGESSILYLQQYNVEKNQVSNFMIANHYLLITYHFVDVGNGLVELVMQLNVTLSPNLLARIVV